MKNFIKALFVVMIPVICIALIRVNTLADGWEMDDENTWYYYIDDEPATGWQQIDGTWYYFSETGAMLTGWLKDGGSWYYFRNSGAMATGWQQDGGYWYYFSASGKMLTGWQQISGTWYYFKSSGAMTIGWLKDGGSWYYFKNSGAMATGWQQDGDYWYYFSASGKMLTGWQLISGKWRYFNPGTGEMNVGLGGDSSHTYYFNENGVIQTGWIHRVEPNDISKAGDWYYADENGYVQKGWQTIGGKRYYFNVFNYSACRGSNFIDGQVYIFGEDCALVQKPGWFKYYNYYYPSYDHLTWFYMKSDGTPVTGWKKLDGSWFYFAGNGEMARNTTSEVDGRIYAFSDSGALPTKEGWMGYTDLNGVKQWVWVYSDGTVATGWKKVGGSWYYFRKYTGEMEKGTSAMTDSGIYVFSESGAMIEKEGLYDLKNGYKTTFTYYVYSNGKAALEWKKIGENWYYFDIFTGHMIKNDTARTGDKTYVFLENGAMNTTEGWIKFTTEYGDIRWVYSYSDGTVATGWKEINGTKYFFDDFGFLR